jgi:hypothetical protein
MPPARSTIQMLLAYANAIWVALTVGVRSKRVGAPFGVAASAINRRSASKARRRESNRKAGLDIGLSSGKVWQHLYHEACMWAKRSPHQLVNQKLKDNEMCKNP